MNYDDDLAKFAAEGALPLPPSDQEGYVEVDGARVWYAAYGAGPAVILLHGGLGNSRNWGYQVPFLVENGYRAVVVDSRGHGRSSRDDRPFTYDQMALDTLLVMDWLAIGKASFVGWSDGACTSLILASTEPSRVEGVFFFACNMDPSGTKEITDFPPILQRCYGRHVADYKELSPTPDQFQPFSEAVMLMEQTQPNYTDADLAAVSVPVMVVLGEHDEFIKREHAEYMVANIPSASFVELPDVSHFAPLQRPEVFNATMLGFLKGLAK